MAVDVVIGVGIACFLLAYIAFQINRERKEFMVLAVILLVLSMLLMMLIPKHLIDDESRCEIVVANATVSGNDTLYQYTTACNLDGSNTRITFFKGWSRGITAMITFIMLYVVYNVFSWMGLIKWKRMKKK